MKESNPLIEKRLDNMFQFIDLIAFFVHKGEYFYVLDYKYNFLLNMKFDLECELKKGLISKEVFDEKLAGDSYRYGLWQLTEQNVETYLEEMEKESRIVSLPQLKELLTYGFGEKEINRLARLVNQQISDKENLILGNDDSNTINRIASRLPFFYINFDTKTYYHLEDSREHEIYAYKDWNATEKDFEVLIPIEQRFWLINGINLWNFRWIFYIEKKSIY